MAGAPRRKGRKHIRDEGSRLRSNGCCGYLSATAGKRGTRFCPTGQRASWRPILLEEAGRAHTEEYGKKVLVMAFALSSTFALAQQNEATGAQGGATGVPGLKTNPTPAQATQGGPTGVPGVKTEPTPDQATSTSGTSGTATTKCRPYNACIGNDQIRNSPATMRGFFCAGLLSAAALPRLPANPRHQFLGGPPRS